MLISTLVDLLYIQAPNISIRYLRKVVVRSFTQPYHVFSLRITIIRGLIHEILLTIQQCLVDDHMILENKFWIQYIDRFFNIGFQSILIEIFLRIQRSSGAMSSKVSIDTVGLLLKAPTGVENQSPSLYQLLLFLIMFQRY